MKVSEKSKKAASQIEMLISQVIRRHLTPEDIGFLTVSAVELSGDFQVCDVFVSSLNGPRFVLKPLQKKAKLIAHDLKKELKLNYKLELRFKEDKSIERAEKLKHLMDNTDLPT